MRPVHPARTIRPERLHSAIERLRSVYLVGRSEGCGAFAAWEGLRGRRGPGMPARYRIGWAAMRSISGRVNSGVVLVCVVFGVVAAGIGVAGVVAVLSSTAVGATIVGDELTTANPDLSTRPPVGYCRFDCPGDIAEC